MTHNDSAALIASAVTNELVRARLAPDLERLSDTLREGGDPAPLLGQIAAELPAIQADLERTLGPLLEELAARLDRCTDAARANTAALRETQFQQTTVVRFGQ